MAKHYAVFDENGKPTVFFADDVNDDIPQVAVEITEEQWQTLLSRGDATWQDGEVIVPPMQPLGVPDA
jgi:hypothetical protein